MASTMQPAPLKPSTSYGSPRSSPFRRPESPASPSPLRTSTPNASPTKYGQAAATSRFANGGTIDSHAGSDAATPRGLQNGGSYAAQDSYASSSDAQRTTALASRPSALGSSAAQGGALSQLQPSQVRTIREGFQILDRDSDGTVGREDVADMLNQLGLPSNSTDVSKFFPPSSSQTITVAAFVNSLATTLASLSTPSELTSAFSAFDDDDSGQVDLAELCDALLHTAPEPGERALTAAEIDQVMEGFTGKRAFTKSMAGPGGLGKRGEVFRYQDFVASLAGSSGNGEAAASAEAEQ